MQNTVIVEVTRRVAHPLYKKLLKRTSNFKVDTAGQTVHVGDMVAMKQTRPLSRGKFFVLVGKEEKK